MLVPARRFTPRARLLLLAVLASAAGGPVAATQVTASGTVVIENAAGVGLAFDIRGSLLSATFLVSQPGVSVSVRLDRETARFMPGQQGVATADGMIVVLADEMVSVTYAPVNSGLLQAARAGTMIMLAQFN